MKNTNRVCDICGKSVPDNSNSSKLIDAGWSELRYSFGTSHNAYNALSSTKDVCPECSSNIGMIRINENKRAIRPESKDKINECVDKNIMDHIREFITQVGDEEGWYKNE